MFSSGRHSLLTLLRPSGAAPTFPSVTLRDNFNRTNAASLGANWTVDPLSFGDVSPVILSNRAAVPNTTDYGCAAWNVANFGPDVAASMAIGVAGSGASWGATIYARVVDSNNYYYFGTGASGNSFLGNGTGASIVPDITIPIPIGAGDKIGIVCRGSAIEGWVYQSGVWSRVISGTDTTTSTAGQVMLEIADDAGALAVDDFSAATL